MRVRLNLATKRMQTHRKFLAISGVAGAAAAILFLVLGWHVYSVMKANESLRVKLNAVRGEMVSLERQRQDLEQFFARPENAKLHDRSAFLNTIIDEESLNWTQMFMDIEKILPAGVRVESIEPKFEKNRVQVKLMIGASSDDAKLKFLNALENSPSFSQVQLISEKAPVLGTDHSEIELTAIYARI